MENALNTYEARQEARRQRYLDRAAKSQAASAAGFDQAHRMTSVIPLGQPILIGHHSERGDRNYRARIDRTFVKASLELTKAKRYEQKAAGVGKGGISSDDPEAIGKLKAKIEKAQESQEAMKAANRIIKSKKLTDEEKVAQVSELLRITTGNVWKLLKPDFMGRVGFPSYAMQNNLSNIKRMQARVAELEAASQQQDIERRHGNITYREQDNRVELQFPGKPSEAIRRLLKSQGFKWSPSRPGQPWVRMLNNAGRYAAEYVIKKIEVGGI